MVWPKDRAALSSSINALADALPKLTRAVALNATPKVLPKLFTLFSKPLICFWPLDKALPSHVATALTNKLGIFMRLVQTHRG